MWRMPSYSTIITVSTMNFKRMKSLLATMAVVAVMVVPAYRNARREVPGDSLVKGGAVLETLIIIAYIMMAVGSVVTY